MTKKRKSLERAITDTTSLIGKDVPKEVIRSMFIAICRNLQDLYDFQEFLLSRTFELRKDIYRLSRTIRQLPTGMQHTTNIQEQVNDMQKKIDETYGPLSDIINKIRKREENGGGMSAYG